MKNPNIDTQGTRKYLSMLLSFMVLLGISAFAQTAQGQTSYKIAEGSKITVSGTSNLHDWNMLASNFTCEGMFVLKSGQLEDISSLSFLLPVTNLKSKDKLMDTRSYKALKSDEFSTISFKLTKATVLPLQKVIKATGNLTIAGVKNEITIQSSSVLNSDGTFTLTGSRVIKMSDYNIKAPTFMMGALKTGNEVTIDILLKLKKASLITQTN